ncbi:MAG TPA: TIGR01777 family oxidoreductase [Gemmatimonadales bacterium]|nr:TIGR01777 family oxidoreductase [Gemmatimonadales bacterium]
MRVVISGASGLLGSALIPALQSGGHHVTRLARGLHSSAADAVSWDPGRGRLDPGAVVGADAVINLSGEIILGRWTPHKRRRIRESRVNTTQLLAETLARLETKPQVLICASAMGIYGDRGEETLTEQSEPGTGFLADLGRDWEAAAAPAERVGIRVVSLRTGLVLASRGGVLAPMLLPFRLGLGGPIGNGRAWWSWVTVDDVVQIILFALTSDNLHGPVNVVAPQPVRNAEFARTLGRVLGRPALIPVPPFALRLAFGREPAQEMMLGSLKVVPARLQAAGYEFRFPELEPALRHVLGVRSAKFEVRSTKGSSELPP